MQEVLNFWFNDLTPNDWFTKSDDLDNQIKQRFLNIYEQTKAGENEYWRKTPKGRLAEIIILDQFPRNIFRDTSQAFSTDNQALTLSQEAIRSGADKNLNDTEKQFLYMPFMHSESLKIHQTAMHLFKTLPKIYEFEIKHKEIIESFGRYPHRNKALERISTEEEIKWMKSNDGF